MREYKDRYPDEWTVLEGQQHLSHSTIECLLSRVLLWLLLLSKEIGSTTTLLSSSEAEGHSGSYPYNCGGARLLLLLLLLFAIRLI